MKNTSEEYFGFERRFFGEHAPCPKCSEEDMDSGGCCVHVLGVSRSDHPDIEVCITLGCESGHRFQLELFQHGGQSHWLYEVLADSLPDLMSHDCIEDYFDGLDGEQLKQAKDLLEDRIARATLKGPLGVAATKGGPIEEW